MPSGRWEVVLHEAAEPHRAKTAAVAGVRGGRWIKLHSKSLIDQAMSLLASMPPPAMTSHTCVTREGSRTQLWWLQSALHPPEPRLCHAGLCSPLLWRPHASKPLICLPSGSPGRQAKWS